MLITPGIVRRERIGANYSMGIVRREGRGANYSRNSEKGKGKGSGACQHAGVTRFRKGRRCWCHSGKGTIKSSVSYPDLYWVCIHRPPGSGSVFGIQIRI